MGLLINSYNWLTSHCVRLHRRFYVLFLVPYVLGTVSQAEDRYFLGDFKGERSALENKGITINSVLICDFMRNVKGGIKPGGTGLGQHNFTVELDLDKMDLVEGGKVFFYYLSNWGGSPSDNYVGDYQVVDNIDTFSTTKVYEAFYEQTLLDGNFSILGGIHDYNLRFDVLNYGLHLINSSFGLGPDISQIPPSNFPSTTLGLMLKYQPTDKTYGLLGFYDGRPGGRGHIAGTRINLEKNDGIMSAYELGYLDESDINYKKFSFGGWYSTAKYEDYSGTLRNSNKGIYFLSEAKVFDEGKEDRQGLGLFGSMGFADGTRNRTQFYTGGGFLYRGLIPERDLDILTGGIAYSRNSSTFVDINQSKRAEATLELMYKHFSTQYLDVAPDFQYVINPGRDPSYNNAYVIGIRVDLSM